MKKFSILIVLICICIGFSGCALFVPVWECLTEPYPATTYYYYGGCYHTTPPPHGHTHYRTYHHYHRRRRPHKPNVTHTHVHSGHTHKPNGHVGGHKPTGRPNGSGSRTGGSRTSSGSRR